MSDTNSRDRRDRLRRHPDGLSFREKLYRGLLLFLLVFAFAISIMLSRIVVIIPAGHAGVLFETLAGGIEHRRNPLTEGMNLKWPWNTVSVYNLRVQKSYQDYDVIAANGLHFKAEIAFRYRPCYNNLTHLHQDVGPQYLESLLVPEVEALFRQVVALCQPEEVISSERLDIQQVVLAQLKREFSHQNISGELAYSPPQCAFPKDALMQTTAAKQKPVPVTEPKKLAKPKKKPLPGSLSASRKLREDAYARELDNARRNLAPQYLKILKQADVLSTDEDLEEFLTGDEDKLEVCGFTKKDVLARMRHVKDGEGGSQYLNVSGENAGDMFFIQDVLIRSIELPKRVRDAVERKVEQEHLLREYRYRVKRELMESLRKEAEAEGIKSFERVTGGNISEDYLRWRGIDATVKLSTSPNSKLVILGGGKDRLPIILNPESFDDNRTRAQSVPAAKLEPENKVPSSGAAIAKPGGEDATPAETPAAAAKQ